MSRKSKRSEGARAAYICGLGPGNTRADGRAGLRGARGGARGVVIADIGDVGLRRGVIDDPQGRAADVADAVFHADVAVELLEDLVDADSLDATVMQLLAEHRDVQGHFHLPDLGGLALVEDLQLALAAGGIDLAGEDLVHALRLEQLLLQANLCRCALAVVVHGEEGQRTDGDEERALQQRLTCWGGLRARRLRRCVEVGRGRPRLLQAASRGDARLNRADRGAVHGCCLMQSARGGLCAFCGCRDV